jgi:hypothetical protein
LSAYLCGRVNPEPVNAYIYLFDTGAL